MNRTVIEPSQRGPSSKPKNRMKLGEIIQGSKFSPKNSTIKNEPLTLPKFSTRKGHTKENSLEISNFNFSNKMNKILPVETIRKKSPPKHGLADMKALKSEPQSI